jgi:hypothetical protein
MNWSPGIVPYGADQTVYVVVDSFGAAGALYRETEVERPDLETIITDLLSGQFNAPVRIVAFNTLEHWAEDVSQEVAEGIQTRCDIEGEPVPEYIRDFVESQHTGVRQSTMRGLDRDALVGSAASLRMRLPN